MLTHALAVVAVLLTGLRVPLALGIVPGLVVAVVMAPVWLPALRRYRGGWTILVLTAAALLNGWWLHEWAAADHRVDTGLAIGTTMLVAGIVAGMGVLLWARLHLHDAWVGALLALGLTVSEVVAGQWGTNPWKFGLVVPASLLLLSLAWLTRRRLLEITALTLLAVVSVTQDARSAFALFALAASLIMWQVVPAPTLRRRHSVLAVGRAVLLLSGVAAAVYNVGSTLVVEGFLGEAARERSLRQISQSGSLIVGGRPELAATVALMRERPEGFGPGTMASPSDVLVARSGMEGIGYDTANGYVERFMFGSQIRLHSVVGELWAFLGVAGLVLALALIAVIVNALARSLTVRAASGLAVWLTCLTVWNALFGPLYGSAGALLAALGLVLLRRDDDAELTPDAGGTVARTP